MWAGYMFVAKVNEIHIRDVFKIHLYFMLGCPEETRRKLIKPVMTDRLLYNMKLLKHNLCDGV
jgi:hypothetical protein